MRICFCFIKLGYIDNHGRYARDDSSASDDGGDSQSTIFIIGGSEILNQSSSQPATPLSTSAAMTNLVNPTATFSNTTPIASNCNAINNYSNLSSAHSVSAIFTSQNSCERLVPILFVSLPFSVCRFRQIYTTNVNAFMFSIYLLLFLSFCIACILISLLLRLFVMNKKQ